MAEFIEPIARLVNELSTIYTAKPWVSAPSPLEKVGRKLSLLLTQASRVARSAG